MELALQRLASLCDSVPAQQRSFTRQSPNVTKREPTRQPHKNKNSRPQTSKVGPKMTPTKPQEYAGKTWNDGIHWSKFEGNTDDNRDTINPQKSMNGHVVIQDKAEKQMQKQSVFKTTFLKTALRCKLMSKTVVCLNILLSAKHCPSVCIKSRSKCQECRHQRVRF